MKSLVYSNNFEVLETEVLLSIEGGIDWWDVAKSAALGGAGGAVSGAIAFSSAGTVVAPVVGTISGGAAGAIVVGTVGAVAGAAKSIWKQTWN
ncbi:Blp family class II bacteriocin [Paenibacillus amylolyticus]|uniref:Blp family class II bacteriocin n=1 Tax=Paenibacillus amylolyticus TaxID=1451 RepID=UPI003EBDA036